MRGTPSPKYSLLKLRGIIPAYAGNTSFLWEMMWMAGDHPRVCGEHYMSFLSERMGAGSSPRMRGTLALRGGLSKLFGIIPAYAGNTLSFCFIASWVRDHPRVCGEHLQRPDRTRTETGSSPRMRGTLESRKLQSGACGIIPAYAGNTVIPSTS